MRRAVAAVFVLSVLAPRPGGAIGTELTQPACAGIPDPTVFVDLAPDVLENLALDGSYLWVSDSTAGQVRRFDPAGGESGAIPVASPAAITKHDGLFYVNSGNNAPGSLLQTHQSKVVTFDPAGFDPNGPPPTLSLYASGFNMANGAAFDGAGNLYVSNDFDDVLVKIPAGGGSYSTIATAYSTNGLVRVGGVLYAALTFDQRSAIEAISLDDYTHQPFVQLTFGVATLEPGVHPDPDEEAPLLGVKGLDDMTLGPDGRLYVAANGTGELIRVDLDGTPDACLVAWGLHNPSSVRFAPGTNGSYAGDAFITEFSGRIMRIDL
jgi:hypothetical protein